jgi:hypothetical protein
MTTEYLPHLVNYAQVGGELGQLQNDLQNASTPLALQDVVKRMFNILSVLMYHSIYDAVGRMPGGQMPQQPAAEPVRAPAPAPALAPQSPMHSNFGLPGLPRPPLISQPGLAPAASSGGMPGIAPSDVANVVITPQGTQVIPPAGTGTPPISLPPNTAVDLAHMTGRPELPPAPPGVAQVVLPPGGALPADVAAALANRGGNPPAP